MKEIIFALILLLTLGVFTYSLIRLARLFRLTKKYPIGDYGGRFKLMLRVAFGQSKILRYPYTGLLHALVFWGFLVITFGSLEMLVDGLTGSERAFAPLGIVYDIIIACGDIMAVFVLAGVLFFLIRRIFVHTKRFEGIEMKRKSHYDANIALTIILFLMISLLGMNTFYVLGHSNPEGIYPVSSQLSKLFPGTGAQQIHLWHEINWWMHILLIFLFANILPYSKHFHVFTSIPNVYLSRLEPLGYLNNMPEITTEVKLMLQPDDGGELPEEGDAARFGVKDIEDIHWKNYLDSLACTQCGRCTAACPANQTGKRLSPRKIIMNVRQRMKEKGPELIKNKEFVDQKALISDAYVHDEELWACTTCNACAQECPVNINHPSLIVDMRRYLTLEEGAAPAELNTMVTNIQNNGAPWQYPPEDRMNWAENLYLNR